MVTSIDRATTAPLDQAAILKIISVELFQLFGIVADVTLSTNFKQSFSLDSLDIAELIVVVEEHFKITIPDHLAGQVITAGDLVTCVVSCCDKATKT